MVSEKSNPTKNNTKAKYKLKWVILIVIVLVIIITFIASTEYYSSDAIRGKVVDSKTKMPVEGAIVMVDWLVVSSEGRHAQQLAVMEAVTNKEGYFELPGWGPKQMQRGLYTVLRNDEPTLRIFKPGYIPVVQTNHITEKQNRHLFNSVEVTFNNSTFELEPFYGSIKEYAFKLRFLETSMNKFYVSKNELCGWKSAPKFFVALHKQANTFRAQNIKTNLLTLDEIGSNHCGFAREVFKEYIHENSK